MFRVNDDLSIYVTRGDMVYLKVTAEDKGEDYTFKAGEVLRFKVFGKKDAENVALQKDFPVTADTLSVDIILDGNDTKIGEVISKPKDYWYEVELNPFDTPRTIIGYDEDGPKVFRLFPEGDDIPEYVPDPDVIKVIDTELDMTSDRPVQNQAIARAYVSLKADYDKTKEAVVTKSNATAAALDVERSRIDNLIAHNVPTLTQDLGYLEGITEETKAKVDGSINSDGVFATIKVNWREANQIYGGTTFSIFVIPAECRPIDVGTIHTEDGLDYRIGYDTANKRYYLSVTAQSDVSVAPSGAGEVTMTYELGEYELKDIRVGADGKTYEGAGVAVRAQINSLSQQARALQDRSSYLDGVFVPSMELGSITLNSAEWAYTEDKNSRIRTPKNYTIHLNKGDKVGLSDYSNANYYLGGTLADGTYFYREWRTTDYIVENEGDYGLVVATLKDATPISSASELADLIVIERVFSVKAKVDLMFEGQQFAPILENGTLFIDTGEEDDRDTRLRTGYMPTDLLQSITVNGGYLIAVHQFDRNKVWMENSDWMVYFDKSILSEDCRYIRVVVMDKHNAQLYPDSNVGLRFWYKNSLPNNVSLYTAKRVSVYGDSISTFSGYIPSGNVAYYKGDNCGVNSVEDTWWKKTIKALGMELLVNNSWSGRCVTNIRDAESGMLNSGGWIADNVAQLATEGEEPDVIIVKLGINDFNRAYNCKLGEYDGSQTFPSGADTFREAYAIMLKEIMTKFPLAEVWCCTLMQCERTGAAGFPELNAKGETITKWNDAIKELCDLFGAKVIDHNACGITYFNMSSYMGDYDAGTGDGLHPNAKGHSMIANETIRTMDNNVRTRY